MNLIDISQLGVPKWLILITTLWILVWKALGLWKSARKNHLIWFIVLLLVNTMGILEILYFYIFSEIKLPKIKKAKRR